jgi:hypothetical protein
MAGKPVKYRAGMDALSYSTGYVQGQARRREINAVNSRTEPGRVPTPPVDAAGRDPSPP